MIIIADVHLGKTNDSFLIDGVPSQTMDIRKRLRTVLARAKLTKQTIVVAGDVFNRVNPTTQAMAEFFDWLTLCSDAGVAVYLIGGNHDAGVDWSSMEMFYKANLMNVYVVTLPDQLSVHEVTDKANAFPEFSREVVFWPHVPTAVQESAEQGHGNLSRWVATMYPKAKFVITHGTITSGYENDIFFEAGESMKIDPEEFSELKLMVLGHEHGKHIGPNWVYPGSLTINNFGEVDEEKGWVEVNLETLDYEWYAFPDDVTPWVHLELDLTEKDETSLDEDQIEGIVTGAVVKITVEAKAHGVVNEAYIRQMINKYGYVTRFETKITGEVTSTVVEERKSHRELLIDFVESSDGSAVEKARAIRMGSQIIEEVQT